MILSGKVGSNRAVFGKSCEQRQAASSKLSGFRSLEGELCNSDNLADSREADEKSELSSVLIHLVASEWLCQTTIASTFRASASLNSTNFVVCFKK
jgi:hypothetical protein